MAEPKIKENCSWCKYFWGDNIIMGVCKRFPKAVNKHDADWCGEFIRSEQIKVVIPEPAVKLVIDPADKIVEAVEPKKRGRKPKNA